LDARHRLPRHAPTRHRTVFSVAGESAAAACGEMQWRGKLRRPTKHPLKLNAVVAAKDSIPAVWVHVLVFSLEGIK
jgi:hypothetical protein